jgi:hypothetical protein
MKLMYRYLLIANLLSPVWALGQCTVCFSPAVIYPVGANPYSIASTDFNGDGIADLAVANWGGSSVSVLLGTGTGTFGAATNFAVGTNPRSILTADFNADGKKDFATANDGTNNVSIRLGNGTGGFGATTNFVVAPAPEGITKGDFNGDGITDLATANYGSVNTSILTGTGTGSFTGPVNYAAGAGCFPSGICTADFNADAKADIVMVSSSFANLSRITGNGLGGFAAPASYGTGGTGAYQLATADFNGDGKPDLAIPNAFNNTVSRLSGSGGGAFGAAVTYAAGSFPYCLTTADFNLDAKVDLAVANYSSNDVSVLMGMGTGAFCAAVNFASLANSPTSVCSADFNGDGLPDLAVSNNNSNNISILLNCTAVVPVELLSFQCSGTTGNETLLEWSTAAEAENDYFLLEGSVDGIHYEVAGKVEGAGSSGQLHNYSFAPAPGNPQIRYYRLTEVDLEGHSRILETVACESSSGGPVRVNIYSVSGQLMQSFYSMDYREDLESVPLPDGIFMLEIREGMHTEYVKYFRNNRF